MVVILLSLATLLSCATRPPNVEACIRLNRGAACTYTLNGYDRDMSEAEYLDQEIGQIFMRSVDWGEVRTFIEKVCQKERTCDLSKIKRKLNYIQSQFFQSTGDEL